MENRIYLFSVVSAVYNVAPYLRETVDSLLAQDIGFENVQVILVDDGSTDGSGAICDEYAARYPENIFVIHKENGGVASARNAGLEHMRGQYVNFMDADDKLAPETLSYVYRFLSAHRGETDVASIPMMYFEGKTNSHILNYKFDQGERVIDLEKEWAAPQLSAASAFIAAEALTGKTFDTRLRYAEDAKLLQQILLGKKTLGVVPGGCYLYRARISGPRSALQRQAEDPNWYLGKLKYFARETLDTCASALGSVPKFIQFTVMYDLQWYLRKPALPSDLLTADEQAAFRSDLRASLRRIDDDVIMAARSLKPEQKLYALSLKHGKALSLAFHGDDPFFVCGEPTALSPVDAAPEIQRLSFDREGCTIEGVYPVFPISGPAQELVRELDGTVASLASTTDGALFSLGEEILQYRRFCFRVPLSPERREHYVRIGIRVQDRYIWPKVCAFGPFSGLSDWYASAFFIRGGWCVQNRCGLAFTPSGPLAAVGREVRFLWELFTARIHKGRRAVLYRLGAHFLRLFQRRPLWLILGPQEPAGKPETALFSFLTAAHPELDVRLVLPRQSADDASMRKIGRVISAGSVQYRLLRLLCRRVVSRRAEPSDLRPFGPKDAPYRDMLAGRRFFLLREAAADDPAVDVSGVVVVTLPKGRDAAFDADSCRQVCDAILASAETDE